MKENNPGCNCCEVCLPVCGDGNWLVRWSPQKEENNPTATTGAQMTFVPMSQTEPNTTPKLTFNAPASTVIEGNKAFTIPGTWLDSPDPSKGDWTNATINFAPVQNTSSVLPQTLNSGVFNEATEIIWTAATSAEYTEQPGVDRYQITINGVEEGDNACQLDWNDFSVILYPSTTGTFGSPPPTVLARSYRSICDQTVHCQSGSWPQQLLLTVTNVQTQGTGDGTLCGNLNRSMGGYLCNIAGDRQFGEARPDFRPGHQFEAGVPNTKNLGGSLWWEDKPAYMVARYRVIGGSGGYNVDWIVGVVVDCRPDCGNYPTTTGNGLRYLNYARWGKSLGTSKPNCSDLSSLGVGPSDYTGFIGAPNNSGIDAGYNCDYSQATLSVTSI